MSFCINIPDNIFTILLFMFAIFGLIVVIGTFVSIFAGIILRWLKFM